MAASYRTLATRVALLGLIIIVANPVVGKPTQPVAPKTEPKPAREKVAIASFALPKAFDGVTSSSLVDLMLKVAKDSTRYQAVLPNDHLATLLETARIELATGRLPKGVDKDKLNVRFLLIPAASRVGKTTVLTATLVDLNRSEVMNTVSADETGEPEVVFKLVEKLWQQLDSPCTGSFRVVGDGQVWDLPSSRAVVYDGRNSLLERARRLKPGVKKAEVAFELVGIGLLKSELRFDADPAALLGSWDHDGTKPSHLLMFEADSQDDIFHKIWKYMNSKINVKMDGVFYLRVQDRFGGIQRLDLEKANWEIIRKPGVDSTTIRVEKIKY